MRCDALLVLLGHGLMAHQDVKDDGQHLLAARQLLGLEVNAWEWLGSLTSFMEFS